MSATMENYEIRRLDVMPFDRCFEVDGNSTWLHATGYEVRMPYDDVWWNEYADNEGNTYYAN